MTRRLHTIAMLVTSALLAMGIVPRASAQTAQSVPAQNPSQPQDVSQSAPAPDTSQPQAVSQTGLLPLFAVDMEIDPAWIDGDTVPSTSAAFSHNGVNDVFDQAWTTLKPAGFNAIRFRVRLDDPKAPIRLANLCLWASSNSVRLIPVLQGTDSMRKNSSDMAGALNTFIATLISRLQGSSAALTPYTQISFYQLERSMNHTGLYPGLKAASAQKLLLASSAALRQAETQALQGTGVQGTPISVGASYDFELIRQGAIAGVPLDASVEQKAQASLQEFLKGFDSTNIDAINVEWFPRSLSSGDVDHFVTLLRFLKPSLAEKQVTLTTGFSSAFNPAEQALEFYAAAVSNLGSFRASEGVDSKFVGVVFQQAFKGTNADSPAPAGTADPSQWKWSDRARQLSEMWSHGKASADMAWWASKVQDNMGLMALNPAAANPPSVTPLPTLQALQEIASTLTQASQQIPPAAIPAPSADPTPAASPAAVPGTNFVPPTTGYVPGAQPSTQAASSPFQQLLFTLLQQFTQQMTTKLLAKFDSSNSQSRYLNPASTGVAPSPDGTIPSATGAPASVLPAGPSPVANTVWIGPSDITVSTTSLSVGQSVSVTAQVHNQSATQDVSGLTVELINPASSTASSPSIQSGLTVPHSGAVPVQLTWAPDATSVGDIQLVLQALDSNGQMVTTVAIPKLTVQSSNGSSDSASVANAGVATPDPITSSAANSGSAVTTTSTNSGVASPTGSSSDTTSAGNSGITTPTGSTANTTSPGDLSATNPTGSATGPVPAPTPTPQVQVAAFGFADSSSSTAGQIPQLQAQISNPSQMPTQSGQAQLFLDGAPQQMQTVGSILPSGTLPLQFPAIQAASGNHSLQLVVTTNDGASATATLTASVTAAPATTSSGPPTSQPINIHVRAVGPTALRSVGPTTFRVGNVMQATTTSPGGVATQTPAATHATTPAPTGAPSPSSAPPASRGTGPLVSTLPRGSVRTITPSSPQSGGTTATNPAATTIAITRSTNAQPQSPAPSTGSGSGAVASIPPRPLVRTITPSSAQATPPVAVPQLATTPQRPVVRTITPPGATASLSTTNAPAAPPSPKPSTSASAPAATIANPGVRTLTPGTASAIPVGTPSSPIRTMAANPASPAVIASNNYPAQPIARKPAAVTPASTPAVLDLAISTQDVHVVPSPPRAGQTATFSAVIRNTGTVPAQGATVVFSLVANGQRLATSSPMVINVPPHGAFPANWSTGMPAVPSAQVMISVVANGDLNPANNQAVVPFAVVGSPAKPPVKPR